MAFCAENPRFKSQILWTKLGSSHPLMRGEFHNDEDVYDPNYPGNEKVSSNGNQMLNRGKPMAPRQIKENGQ